MRGAVEIRIEIGIEIGVEMGGGGARERNLTWKSKRLEEGADVEIC